MEKTTRHPVITCPKGIHLDLLQKTTGLRDPDSLQQLIDLFAGSLDDSLTALTQTVEASDKVGFLFAIDKLAGSACYLSPILCRLTKDILALAENHTLEELTYLYDILITVITSQLVAYQSPEDIILDSPETGSTS